MAVAPAPSKKAVDQVLKHTIRADRVAAGTSVQLRILAMRTERRLLREFEEKLRRIYSSGSDHSPAMTRRLMALIQEIRQSAKEGFGVVSKSLSNHLEDFALLESQWSRKHLASLKAGAELKSRTAIQGLTAAEARAIVKSTPMQGVVLREWAKKYPERYVNEISKAVQDGVFVGRPIEEILSGLRGTNANRLLDGALAPARDELRTVVQTSHAHVANNVREATYLENKDVVPAVEWVATLDDRTCEYCAARDGLRWSLPDFEPMGHDVPYDAGVPGHWNCRCVIVGVTDIEVPSERESFESWIARQPMDVKAEIFGKNRAALLDAGKVAYRALWGSKGEFLTLRELARAEGISRPFAAAPRPPRPVRPKPTPAITDVPALGKRNVIGDVLRDGDVIEVKNLQSNTANDVFRMVLKPKGGEGRVAGYWKPGESPRYARQIKQRLSDPTSGQIERELFAKKLNDVLGFDLVPNVEARTYKGKPGTIMLEAPGKTASKTDLNLFSKISRKEWLDLTVYDVVAGNTDRHLGNALFSTTSRPARLTAIDNGLTFSGKNPWSGGDNWRSAVQQKGLSSIGFRKMTSEEITHYVNLLESDALRDAIESAPFSDAVKDAAFERIERLIRWIESGNLVQNLGSAW